MSARDFSTRELDALGVKYRNVSLDKGARVLIVSSPAPEAVLASTLLCRSIMKTGGVFHITFVEPVIDARTLERLLDANPKHTIIVIGADVTDDVSPNPELPPPIVIGGRIRAGAISEHSFNIREQVPVGAYVIAREKLELGLEELYLAAAGLLVQDQSLAESDRVLKEIVLLAQERNTLRERRGFRAFGTNFLPLIETLSSSISPYLRGISGALDSCERILSEADIPPSRRNMPIEALASEEKRRLTEKLTLKLDVSAIRRLLGLDFENCLEPESSPLRFLSAVKSMSEVAWSRHETGLAMAVWMGDRARMLRMLLDSYRLHCRQTISGVERFMSIRSKNEVNTQSDSVAVAPMSTVPCEVLSDVGRIIFEISYVDPERFLVLETEDCACVVWASDDMSLSDVLQSFMTAGLSSSSASPKSVLVQLPKEKRQNLVNAIGSLAGEMR